MADQLYSDAQINDAQTSGKWVQLSTGEVGYIRNTYGQNNKVFFYDFNKGYNYEVSRSNIRLITDTRPDTLSNIQAQQQNNQIERPQIQQGTVTEQQLGMSLRPELRNLPYEAAAKQIQQNSYNAQEQKIREAGYTPVASSKEGGVIFAKEPNVSYDNVSYDIVPNNLTEQQIKSIGGKQIGQTPAFKDLPFFAKIDYNVVGETRNPVYETRYGYFYKQTGSNDFIRKETAYDVEPQKDIVTEAIQFGLEAEALGIIGKGIFSGGKYLIKAGDYKVNYGIIKKPTGSWGFVRSGDVGKIPAYKFGETAYFKADIQKPELPKPEFNVMYAQNIRGLARNSITESKLGQTVETNPKDLLNIKVGEKATEGKDILRISELKKADKNAFSRGISYIDKENNIIIAKEESKVLTFDKFIVKENVEPVIPKSVNVDTKTTTESYFSENVRTGVRGALIVEKTNFYPKLDTSVTNSKVKVFKPANIQKTPLSKTFGIESQTTAKAEENYIKLPEGLFLERPIVKEADVKIPYDYKTINPTKIRESNYRLYDKRYDSGGIVSAGLKQNSRYELRPIRAAFITASAIKLRSLNKTPLAINNNKVTTKEDIKINTKNPPVIRTFQTTDVTLKRQEIPLQKIGLVEVQKLDEIPIQIITTRNDFFRFSPPQLINLPPKSNGGGGSRRGFGRLSFTQTPAFKTIKAKTRLMSDAISRGNSYLRYGKATNPKSTKREYSRYNPLALTPTLEQRRGAGRK